jgi:hypothetical protein
MPQDQVRDGAEFRNKVFLPNVATKIIVRGKNCRIRLQGLNRAVKLTPRLDSWKGDRLRRMFGESSVSLVGESGAVCDFLIEPAYGATHLYSQWILCPGLLVGFQLIFMALSESITTG